MTDRDRGSGEGREPLDEEAAWAQIVAGYGAEPPDPPGVWAKAELTEGREASEPGDGVEDGREDGEAASPGPSSPGAPGSPANPASPGATSSPGAPDSAGSAGSPGSTGSPGSPGSSIGSPGSTEDAPLRGFTVYSAGSMNTAGQGPRDWEAADPPEEDDHFVPPEPPPLPQADTTTKFAWLAVLGGPALLLAAVLFRWDLSWWMTFLGVGGFVGGFGTLVTRLRDEREDDDWDDPGRGAVV
ncbi:hypothetical protein [Streptomyces sp. WMMC897]|uniref:hypothetical protein n=1 Tax=Streptomyces sp. WMMC897 TaxID=3014782 RepID=UPI0022B69151|nr:hypothetical protein [Streptomyces sp. WMMC897]MCZ7413840.1 hypothetical protein [Streptomyces sp. WMMC897]